MLFIVLSIFLAPAIGSPSAEAANPFETFPVDHWAYETVADFSEIGLLQPHVAERLDRGYRFTYIDLSVWLGDALDRLMSGLDLPPDASERSADLGAMIDVYNRQNPSTPLDDDQIQAFAALLALAADYLDFLGFELPVGFDGGVAPSMRPTMSTPVLDQLRSRAEGPSASSADVPIVERGLAVSSASSAEPSNTVIAHLLPNVLLAGQIDTGTDFNPTPPALKVGATIHPLPDLTVGAQLYATESSGRLWLDRAAEASRGLDLSAEVGEWILSLRRRQVLHNSAIDDVGASVFTRVGLEYPLTERTILRAGRETEEESGAGDGEEHGVKTEVDLEVLLDQGKFGLGFVLESVSDSQQGMTAPLRAIASLEHSVGPIGVATAGITIGGPGSSNEATSNVGLRYDFDDASVFLQYRMFNSVEDSSGLTTAEVSIKF